MVGLRRADPRRDPSARHILFVEALTPEIEAMGGDPVSGLSKGGMKTKLMAARTAIAGGCAMAIAEGSVMRPLSSRWTHQPKPYPEPVIVEPS